MLTLLFSFLSLMSQFISSKLPSGSSPLFFKAKKEIKICFFKYTLRLYDDIYFDLGFSLEYWRMEDFWGNSFELARIVVFLSGDAELEFSTLFFSSKFCSLLRNLI